MAIHVGVGAAARAFLGRDHKLLIDGRWVESSTGKRTEVLDPATGGVIALAAEGTGADVDAAVRAARAAFEGPWSRVKPAERTRLMFRLAELIEAHGDELAELESLNSGKPLVFCRNADVPGVAEMLRYMAGWATKLGGHANELSLPGEWHAFTMREPIGVVGQIVPWNFPINMAAWKIAPALATGCTIVLKPAEQTPLTALRLGELALEAGIPPGVLNVVTGYGNPVGAALAEHPDVDKVAFTGSTATGKRIAQAATGNLKRVSLELGGKSPFIVFPDADLEAAAAAASRAIFFHAGQVCAAGSRLFAHASIYHDLVAAIGQHAARLKVGHGMEAGSEIGPLISARQLERVSGYVTAGQQQGATVHTGGGRIGETGFFFSPTVLTDVRPGMSVVDEEIFGPVLAALSFEDQDIDRIAAQANDTPFGLTASVWTRDLRVAHRLARRLRAGTVGINVHSPADPSLPFGGYKQSGWGRERGHEVLELYTEVKAVAVNLT